MQTPRSTTGLDRTTVWRAALAAGVLLTALPLQAQPRYKVVNLGILNESAGSSDAVAINAAGTAAGSSGYDPALPSAFRAVIANDQAMTPLAQPAGGTLSRGVGINVAGQVAGWDQVPGATDRRLPVRWTAGVPAGTNAVATRIPPPPLVLQH